MKLAVLTRCPNTLSQQRLKNIVQTWHMLHGSHAGQMLLYLLQMIRYCAGSLWQAKRVYFINKVWFQQVK